MRNVIPLNQLCTGDQKICYDFLVKNELLEGSSLRKSLRFVNKLTEGYKFLHNLSGLLDKGKFPTFWEAKYALYRFIKDKSLNVLVCIDDIDEIGFNYSHADRVFINSLLILCMRLNTKYIDEKTPIRFMLTSPNELFYHAELWNTDKILGRSIHLQWNDPIKMQRLVNKRIAVELKVKKRNPRYYGDIYSHDSEHTWFKIFPKHIYNKISKKEPTFSYILRHTFYTPRHSLEIAQEILHQLHHRGYSIEDIEKVDESEWSRIFHNCIEEYTISRVVSVQNLFSKIYDNLRSCLEQFDARPNIWTRNNLKSFICQYCSNLLKRTDKDIRLENNKLIEGLFKRFFSRSWREVQDVV